MNRDQIIQMEDDIRVQSQLKRFINDPKDFDFSHGSAVNDYKGDMHRFSLHANKMLCDMLVTHAKYLVNKIDADLKKNGVEE